MKVSTKGRYALRLMLDLAIYNTGEPVRLKDVAKQENISDKYLEQIISILNKAGYVRSIRGPQGGYLLSRNPSEYKIGDILRLTEGSFATVTPETMAENGDGVINRVWLAVDDAVDKVVDSITLDDLLSWYNEQFNNYVI